MRMRILIIEDEPLASEELGRILEGLGHTIVARYGLIREALNAFRADLSAIDLIFLDYELPDGNGLDLLLAADGISLPPVIMATAHGRHAYKAYEVQDRTRIAIVDYILKPYDEKRIELALQRADAHPVRAVSRLEAPAEQAIEVWLPGHKRNTMVLPLGQIERFTMDNSQIVAWIGNDDYGVVHLRSLAEINRLASSADFARISRTDVIRLSAIERIEKRPSEEWRLWMRGGECLPVSESYRPSLAESAKALGIEIPA